MPVTQVEKFLEVVFEIEGSSERSWSFSERYAFNTSTLSQSVRAQMLWLAEARANFLNDDCYIDIVRGTEWPKQHKSIILNDAPIVGKYKIAPTALALQGAAEMTVMAGLNHPNAGAVGSIPIPQETDLDINHPQNCLNFYFEGSEFRTCSRQLSAVPDVFVHDLQARGLPENQLWLLATAVAPNPANSPTCLANYYQNIANFFEGLRAWCAIPCKTRPDDPSKRDLASIERIVFRGVGQRPVGPPKKTFRGRAAISN